MDFANRALEYARSVNKNDYVALAYSTIAAVHRNSGQPDEALKNADIAFTTAISSGNDSAKVVTALELGDVFMQKKDLLMAFRKFSNAYDIANNHRNNYLLSSVYYHFSQLYIRLKSNEQAKEYILKSVELNTKERHTKGLIKDYILIGKIVDFIPAKNYLQRASLLADSLRDPVLKLQINQTLFNQYMINDNSENTFRFLQTHPDVKEALYGLGDHNYEWVIGEIFLYSQKYDSAYIHFKKAEPAYDANYNVSGRINFLSELADCCMGLKLYREAIYYYSTTLQLASTTLNVRVKNNCLNALQQLYFTTGDFEKAYEYAHNYNMYQDSVNKLNKEKDLVLMEIDNENKRIQKENELAEIALQRKHDAQYMLISIIVAAAFILLVLLGLFTVSTSTIKILGFFSFIFFFELVTLLLDKWIHDRTHGEPWKIWLIKICIISLMLPFHHWLEHKLIKYLISRKLIRVGSFFSPRKIFNLFKKQTAPVVSTTEAAEAPGEIKEAD
jgi:tetratricopeptide (TPR) repeat protein